MLTIVRFHFFRGRFMHAQPLSGRQGFDPLTAYSGSWATPLRSTGKRDLGTLRVSSQEEVAPTNDSPLTSLAPRKAPVAERKPAAVKFHTERPVREGEDTPQRVSIGALVSSGFEFGFGFTPALGGHFVMDQGRAFIASTKGATELTTRQATVMARPTDAILTTNLTKLIPTATIQDAQLVGKGLSQLADHLKRTVIEDPSIPHMFRVTGHFKGLTLSINGESRDVGNKSATLIAAWDPKSASLRFFALDSQMGLRRFAGEVQDLTITQINSLWYSRPSTA